MESYRFEFDGVIFSLQIRRENRRSLKLECPKQGGIVATAPLRMDLEKISDFIQEKKNWILTQNKKWEQVKLLPVLEPKQERMLRKNLGEDACRFYAEKVPTDWKERPLRIQIRKQKSRWGSCSSNGTISLNVYLALLPAWLREYVYMHELCHLRHPHHQMAFWADLESLCPGCKNLRREIKKYRFPEM